MVFALQLLGVIALSMFIILCLVGFYSFWYCFVLAKNRESDLQETIEDLQERLAIMDLERDGNLRIQ